MQVKCPPSLGPTPSRERFVVVSVVVVSFVTRDHDDGSACVEGRRTEHACVRNGALSEAMSRGERASLLGVNADEDGAAVTVNGAREDGVDAVEDDGTYASTSRRQKMWRARIIGVTVGVCVALVGVFAVTGARGAGAGLTLGGGAARSPSVGEDGAGQAVTMSALGASRDGSSMRAINAPGHIPGLAEHVDDVSSATKFRMLTFCNKAYWMFARNLLESMKAVSPSLVDFWTIIVADEETKKYIDDEIRLGGISVDIFVDEDLKTQVLKNRGASKDALKSMLSWRRVHAMQSLIDSDYTTMFLEPDVVIQKNPLQIIHDQLSKNDVVLSSDYGLGKTAREHASTKIVIAKPSIQAKKLFNVWQRAEASYGGDGAEIGFFNSEVAPHLESLTANVKILDQTVVGNFLSHHAKASQSFVTGTGCDDINYKINFMTQVLRHVQPTDPNNPVSEFDYEGVKQGCDLAGRAKVFKLSNEYAKKFAGH